MGASEVERSTWRTRSDLNKTRRQTQRAAHRELERKTEEREPVDRMAAAKTGPNLGVNADTYS